MAMKQLINNGLLAISALFLGMLIFSSCTKKESSPPLVPKPVITSFTPTAVFPGETVTITGTNLAGAVGVSFGGLVVPTYTINNEGSITVVVEGGASGEVKVVTPGGIATLGGFTLKVPPIDGYDNSNQVKAASLIAHWPFDGDARERVHGAMPVLSGGTRTYVAGRIGQAVHLAAGWLTYGTDATSASASNTPYNSNDILKDGFTVSVWAQVSVTDKLSNLFQLSTPGIPNWPILGLNYRKKPDNSFDIDFGLGNVDGTGPHISYAAAFMEPAFIDSFDWAYIAVIYDGADKSLKYYANGILLKNIDLKTLAGGPFPNPDAVLTMIAPNYATIGTFQSTATTPGTGGVDIPDWMANGITGNVDDIRFFNAALTETEMLALYHLGQAGR